MHYTIYFPSLQYMLARNTFKVLIKYRIKCAYVIGWVQGYPVGQCTLVQSPTGCGGCYRVYTASVHTLGHTEDVGGSFSQMLEYGWNHDKNHSDEEDTHGNQN